MAEATAQNNPIGNVPNPLLDGVVEDKSYAHKQVSDKDKDKLNQPPPDYHYPKMEINFDDPPSSGDKDKKGGTAKPGEEEPTELTKKQIDEKTTRTANIYLRAVDDINAVAKSFLKVKPERIFEAVAKDELDPDMKTQVAIEDGDVIEDNLYGILGKTNDTIEEIFAEDPEFKEAVRPPLEEIIRKNKGFISPEMELAFIAGRKLFGQVLMVVNTRKSFTHILNMYKDVYANAKAGYQPAPPPPPTQSVPSPPPQSPPPPPHSERPPYDVDDPDVPYVEAEYIGGSPPSSPPQHNQYSSPVIISTEIPKPTKKAAARSTSSRKKKKRKSKSTYVRKPKPKNPGELPPLPPIINQ